ncbi:YceI family protein [Muricauda sp. 2012CJ35-5]|uniref:YceI family protein n=1 Tax=Flagellimonas spongiicola TaxID=2942208 RepID=A0ABT0PSJ1_9FLAO|nr:YceI family protein [Allomuricauda spongiicola]MCL6274355.1 YceI family protein [Allomuricauda spongiicola]
MKKIILLAVSIGFNTFMYGQGTINIDTEKSVIKWTGSKLFQFNEHYGTVKFSNGTFLWTGDNIMGGHFVVDMKSIVNTDGKYNEMLVSHLKNEDFFDVKNHPIAKLKITQVFYVDFKEISAEALLTIKGITHPINFRMTIEESNKTQVFKSKFVIDRTRWGIQYESKGLIDSVKENIISDAIGFEVVLVTKPGC